MNYRREAEERLFWDEIDRREAEERLSWGADKWVKRWSVGNAHDDGPDEEPLVLLDGDDIAKEEREGRDSKMLIEGLLPARGFCPLIGDSGLGKSPLLMQAAACVATGTPFLGLPVRQGKVLVNDHE